MPFKKVIGELVSKKMPHLSFMRIKKTTQIQGNSASGIVQNHFNAVRVLLWIYTAVKTQHWGTTYDQLCRSNSEFHSVHAIWQM